MTRVWSPKIVSRIGRHWRWVVPVAVLACTSVAGAHEVGAAAEEGPRDWQELARSWAWDPGIVIPLVVSAGLYAWGLRRLWRAAGVGHGLERWEAGCFAAGWLTLVVALVSPLHPWGEVLFSAHMVQHELLMLVAAPLLVLGRPMIAFLHALPAGWARGLAWVSNRRWWRAGWGAISAPMVAWLIHAIVLWGWHAPVLFQATLTNDFVHALQHISFLLSAVLFWWALIHGPRDVGGYGVAVLYLFTTALHSGLLGALLVFTRTVWYPAYDDTAAWGLTGLEDQELGGLIMWIPACTVYIVAGLVMFAAWMREGDRLVARREALGAGVEAR